MKESEPKKYKITNLHPLEVREQNQMGDDEENYILSKFERFMNNGEADDNSIQLSNEWQAAESALKTYRVIDSEAEDFADQFFTDDNQIVNRPYGYTDSQSAQWRGIVVGFNKAKEKYSGVERTVMKWVKVSERLPEKSGIENSVVIRLNTGFVTTGFKSFDAENPQMYFTIHNSSYLDNSQVEWLDESAKEESLSPYKLGQEVDCIVNQDGETVRIVK